MRVLEIAVYAFIRDFKKLTVLTAAARALLRREIT